LAWAIGRISGETCAVVVHARSTFSFQYNLNAANLQSSVVIFQFALSLCGLAKACWIGALIITFCGAFRLEYRWCARACSVREIVMSSIAPASVH